MNYDKIIKNPEEALKTLIAQQTTSSYNQELIHTVIRTVMTKNDNNLKRLLYYYLETMPDDKSLMIYINQISKDLSSPNEYIRGLALQFIGRMENYDYVLNLIKGVKENLVNNNPYVRTNAVVAISELAFRFDIDVEDEILDLLRKECNSLVLVALVQAMIKLDILTKEHLDPLYPVPVLEILIKSTGDVEFLASCLENSSPAVRYKAAKRILIVLKSSDAGKDQELKAECIKIMVALLQENPEYKEDYGNFVDYIDSNVLMFMDLVDSFCIPFSRNVIKRCFEIAETHEFLKISQILYKKYVECGTNTENRREFKVMLLESIASFTESHCIFISQIVRECMKLISEERESVRLVYAALNVLKACNGKMPAGKGGNDDSGKGSNDDITAFLIGIFSTIGYGKIFRLIFDVMAKNINEGQFNMLLDTILADFDRNVFYLRPECETFLGGYACICLFKMFNKGWDCRTKLLGVFLKFIQQGEARNIIDSSSKSAITMCIRAVMSGISMERIEKNNCESAEIAPCNVLEPIRSGLIKKQARARNYRWEDGDSPMHKIVQMSGIGDPIYVEASVKYSKNEVLVDMLVINQTEHYLQDISFDFVHSPNLLKQEKYGGFSLKSNTASSVVTRFSVLESANCMITATMAFRFPKNDDYSSIYVQNLGEIHIPITDFLEPHAEFSSELSFNEVWTRLEWENVYSLSLVSTSLDPILYRISNAVCGRIHDKKATEGLLVANISCCTLTRSPVLINVCLTRANVTGIEVRIRAGNDCIVRDVCGVISEELKRCKQ